MPRRRRRRRKMVVDKGEGRRGRRAGGRKTS